jgi:phage terminase large subunit
VNDGCDWAIDKALDAQADLFTWDADGLGVTLKGQIDTSLKGKKIKYQLFKGSQKPDRPDDQYMASDEKELETNKKTNKETFVNKRAQYYWLLRDRFYNTYRAMQKSEYVDPDTMISISSSIEGLDKVRAEVCRIPRKFNGNGRIQLMGKPEMKDRLKIDSPNMADSMMMSLIVPEQKKRNWGELNYKRVSVA